GAPHAFDRLALINNPHRQGAFVIGGQKVGMEGGHERRPFRPGTADLNQGLTRRPESGGEPSGAPSMSRTTARIATIALFTTPLLAAAPALAQQAPAAATRQPASAEVRAAYDRADARSRSVFWTGQAEINPMDPIAGVRAAQAMRELGRHQEAAEMAERVLLVQPANVEAMLEVGRGHIARGQAFYGIAALERARDARPDDWR